MEKSTFALITIAAVVAIAAQIPETVHTYGDRSLCDAPLIGGGYSGAPGDGTCANSGCHSGQLNGGPGITSFTIDGGALNNYVVGQTYTLDISIDQASISKFGFQVIAYRDSDNSLVGTYTLTDPVRTRLIDASGGRVYVGTTPCGSDANPSGNITWSFDWTAPVTDQGSITFYLTTLATNHNHSGSGDQTYTSVLGIGSGVLNAVHSPDLSSTFQVFPVPAHEQVVINGSLEHAGPMQLRVMDPVGRTVWVADHRQHAQGNFNYVLDLSQMQLTAGHYTVVLRTAKGQGVHALLVE